MNPMIVLKKEERLELYLMLLEIEKKVKDWPYIAILMRACEAGGEITPSMVRSDLLVSLPLKACENLLYRLTDLGYFEEAGVKRERNLNGQYGQNGREPVFRITNKGRESAQAQTKAFWQPEKGAYMVYKSKSPLITRLIGQSIIQITRHRSDNGEQRNTSYILKQDLNKPIKVLNQERREEEIRIIGFEEKCLSYGQVDAILEIEVYENEAVIKIKEKKNKENVEESGNPLGKFSTPLREEEVRDALLAGKFGDSYDKHKKVVRTPFSPEDLRWIRDVDIEKPIYEGVEFEPVQLEGVRFIPSDEEQARMWVEEWLLRNVDEYFWSDEEFQAYLHEKLGIILEFYPQLGAVTRKEMIDRLSKRQNSFYSIAKLEAANYLSY
jgi:hypothetical protein